MAAEHTQSRSTGTASVIGPIDGITYDRIQFGSLSSTNTEAARWATRNPGRRAIISAREQTAGRGRLGRAWSSPPGGAWLTVVWPATDSGAVTLAAAEAACCVIDETIGDSLVGGLRAEIRWPNDLLLAGRKCGGLLGETVGTDAGRVLLLGIGINVNNHVAGPVRTPAVSLGEIAGCEVDLPRFVDRLSAALIGALLAWDRDGFAPEVRERVVQRLWGVGASVELHGAGRPVAGVLVGIDARGGLIVDVDGRRRTYVSGEVSCRGPAGPAREEGV